TYPPTAEALRRPQYCFRPMGYRGTTHAAAEQTHVAGLPNKNPPKKRGPPGAFFARLSPLFRSAILRRAKAHPARAVPVETNAEQAGSWSGLPPWPPL